MTGSYEVNPDEDTECCIKGRKTSFVTVLSMIVSIVLALIPILNGDTQVVDCRNEDSEETETCVVTTESNIIGYIFMSFGSYPWVFFLYWQTGLWMNASGIHAKMNAFYEPWLYDANRMNIFQVIRETFLGILDWRVLLVCFDSMFTLGMYVYTVYAINLSVCGCNNILVTLCRIIVYFCPIISIFVFYSADPVCGGVGVEDRMRRLSRLYFVTDTFLSLVVYVSLYGNVGIIFVLVPVLGYIESFGIFQFPCLETLEIECEV